MILFQNLQVDLEPITAPPAIPSWPPQPGWYFLGLLFLGLVFYGFMRYYIYRKKNAYRVVSLAAIERIKNLPISLDSLNELNLLLKATALKGFSRERVAPLHGKQWLAFLEESCPSSKFNDTASQALVDLIYKKDPNIQITPAQWKELISKSTLWIKRHKVNF
ncbi:DUF4381 domain-containing protein [Eudoraea sp.]|uniref:DUF4381 domain-containing protein n=1 Tax=Eudoraea sp. TaxID=1979955 RepID=UPI003C737BAB